MAESISDDLVNAKTLLELLNDAIITEDLDSLEEITDKFMFEEMVFTEAMSLVIGLLNISYESGAVQSAKLIYNLNYRFLPPNADTEFVILLALNQSFRVDVLEFLIKSVLG